jgi:DNA-binding XRE family transcriptional regulator
MDLMKSKIEVGEKLRQLRVQRNISQETLAKAIFVKNTTISNWENGSRQIQLSNLKLICVYFGVPINYFSDDQITEKLVNKKVPWNAIIATSSMVALSVSVGVVFLGGFSGITNQACYGESNCFVIDDPLISSELETRNLNGGLMTNVELDLVYEYLQQYRLDEATDVNGALIAMLNALGYPEPEQYYVQRMLYHDDPSGLPNHLFDLAVINSDNLQYFIYQNDKYILYKIGHGRFKYEVYANQSYVLTIDLSMNAFYWNDFKFVPPLTTYQRFLNGEVTNQSGEFQVLPTFTLFENLKEETMQENNQVANHTLGTIAFYDSLQKATYVVFIGVSWSFVDGYELGVIMQQRDRIENVQEFRFELLHNFNGTYGTFPEFVLQNENIELKEIGGGMTNDISFFENTIAPYFDALGNQPLQIQLLIES